MDIEFTSQSLPEKGAAAVLVYEGGRLSSSAKALDDVTGGALSRAVEAAGFTGKAGKWLDVVGPEGGVCRVLLAGAGKKKDMDVTRAEKIGAEAAGRLSDGAQEALHLFIDAGTEEDAAAAFGGKLASYRFLKYRSEPRDEEKFELKKLIVHSKNPDKAAKRYAREQALADGIFLTRDLVSEPANVLNPETFAERCAALAADGLDVEILDEADLERLGMNALLAVGRGSAVESRLVVMRWNGGRDDEAPLAFVGKGVTFDSGGISLKPAAGMEEMKWDMGGAGTVTGLMRALARRSARLNAIGVIGLVENMPSGIAQRPGDVVRSYSGQTIEVVNTDAEGRLVLADALAYTIDRFKPAAVIDLATLTGAIIIALGHEKAGLFSNDDDLAEGLLKAAGKAGEGLWRLPLGEEYDRQINSQIADMKNVGEGRAAGSTTAAQFLKRYVGETPWAHIDIAGVAWSKKAKPTAAKGATGFGVRLLDRLIRDRYED